MRRFFQLALRWDAPFRVSSAGFLHAASHNRHHALPSASSLLGQRCFTTSRMARSALDGDSTIYALSTAPGRAAIAVVRVSGPACVQIYKALCPETPLPKPRVAALRALYDPTQSPSPDSLVDAGALVLFFPAPKTVTGEDVLELHLHGGPAIVKSVLGAIAQVGKQGVLTSANAAAAGSASTSASASASTSPIRYAEPGEFTRRAFMNDRLDLPQIEALGQTLSADTEQQRRLAVRGSSTTALSDRYEEWRRMLLYARGEMEALIDFSEDQHFDESSDELVGSVAMQVRALRRQVHAHIRNASRGELMRNGIRVALLGRPNAGKSSLLNLVVGKEAAIVSTEAGTTRDIVDVGVDLGGWFCRFGDMAGIRGEASGGKGEGEEEVSVVVGAVEKEGIRRAKARALESDVVLVILSIERGDGGGDGDGGWTLSVEREVLDATRDCIEAGKCVLVAVNKCDRLDAARSQQSQSPNGLTATVRAMLPTIPEDRVFAISCREAQEGISPDPDHDRDDPGNIQGLLRGFISTFEQMSSPIGIEGEDGDGDGDGESGQFDSNYWEDSLGVTHRQSSNLQRCLDHLDEFLEQAAPSLAPPAAVPRQPERDGSFGVPHGDAAAAIDGVESGVDIVTAAERLRFAADALAMITGRGESGDVEDVLGVIFEKFCVGK